MIFRSILLQVRKEKAKNMRTFTFSTGLHSLQDICNRKRRQLLRLFAVSQSGTDSGNKIGEIFWCQGISGDILKSEGSGTF